MWQHLRTSGAVMVAAVPVGVVLALAAAPVFGDLVYGVSSRDTASLAAAVGAAMLAGGLGTWLPVQRAARANIVKILRES
jgi:ABC-type antimicrobial peptide transport system permease subunit